MLHPPRHDQAHQAHHAPTTWPSKPERRWNHVDKTSSISMGHFLKDDLKWSQYIHIYMYTYIYMYIYIRIIFELQNKILYITWTEFPGFTRISNLHRILYIYICMDMYGCYRIFELKCDLLGMVFFCESKTGDSQSVNSNSGIRLIHGKLYRKQWWCYPKFAGFMQILLRPSLGLNKKNGH
jgi:hypothetical protein